MPLPDGHKPISPAQLAQIAQEVAEVEDSHKVLDKLAELPATLKEGEDTPLEQAEDLLGWCVPASKWVEIPVPEHRWLIPSVLKGVGITIISGQSKKAMKTSFCLRASLSVATGRNFGGITPARSGKVVYILEEGDAGEVQEHIKAMACSMGIPVPDNLYLSYLNNIKLKDPISRQLIAGTIRKLRPAMLVLDNISYMVDGDENSHENVLLAADTVRYFQQVAIIEKMGMVVCPVLHLNKSAKRADDLDAQIRGSTTWRDLYDAHIALRQYKRTQRGAPHANMDIIYRGSSSPDTRKVQWDIDEDEEQRWINAAMYIQDIQQ